MKWLLGSFVLWLAYSGKLSAYSQLVTAKQTTGSAKK